MVKDSEVKRLDTFLWVNKFCQRIEMSPVNKSYFSDREFCSFLNGEDSNQERFGNVSVTDFPPVKGDQITKWMQLIPLKHIPVKQVLFTC